MLFDLRAFRFLWGLFIIFFSFSVRAHDDFGVIFIAKSTVRIGLDVFLFATIRIILFASFLWIILLPS